MYLQAKKPGQWETVKSKAEDKKKRADDKQKKEKEGSRDRLGVSVDPFTAFDKSFAAKAEAAKQQQQAKNYKGAFADLEVEAPPQQLQEQAGSGDDEPAASSNSSAAQKKAPKALKAPKKPKQSVAQVAAGECGFLVVMACNGRLSWL